MNILIIEDEIQPAKRLKRQIEALIPDAIIASPIDNVQEAISILERPPFPDLIFMDIHLSDGDSFEILDQISIPSPIIFTTAYDAYALQAFKANSIDYLLKPIKQIDLEKALEKWRTLTAGSQINMKNLSELLQKANSSNESQYLRRILVRFPEKLKAVDVSDILYFYVESRVTLMQLPDGRQYPVDFNMDQLEQKLSPKLFFRVNRQALVSFQAIHKMHKYSKSRLKLELKPSFRGEVIVSSEKSAAFKKWLMEG